MTKFKEIECGPFHGKVLAAIHRECFEKPWTEKSFVELLSRPGVSGFLAVRAEAGGEDQIPMGFILLQMAADEGEILTLAVSSSCRRIGVANRLLERVLAVAEAAGGKKIYLEVAQNNQGAQAFYDRWNFRQTGIRPGYYDMTEGRVDAVMMVREIDHLSKY